MICWFIYSVRILFSFFFSFFLPSFLSFFLPSFLSFFLPSFLSFFFFYSLRVFLTRVSWWSYYFLFFFTRRTTRELPKLIRKSFQYTMLCKTKISKRVRNYLLRFHITDLRDNSDKWGAAKKTFYYLSGHQKEKKRISIKNK